MTTRRLRVYDPLTDEEHAERVAAMDAADTRQRGKNGLRIIGQSTLHEPDWVALVNALIAHGTIHPDDARAAERALQLDNLTCSACQGSGGFATREPHPKYGNGVRISCRNRCKTTAVLAELGLRPPEGRAENVRADGPPENGADLLDDVRAWFARFICTVHDRDLDLLAVWAVASHLVHETYTTARLQIDSPMPGSGKTTCLEHLQRLALKPVMMATISSPAMLVRILADGPRTLLIDEADRSLALDREGIKDVFAVLNSGYKRGATRPVLVPVKGGGWETREMPTFAPVVIAGNSPNLEDDVRQRIIRILLLPDLDGTAEESDWELVETEAQDLAERIAEWVDAIRDQVRTNRPEMPAGIVGRFREKWSPLRRVADAAGRGWPHVVDQMALSDREQWEMDKEDGMVTERPALLLLKHITEVWPDGERFLPTRLLVAKLIDHAPQVWSKESSYQKDLTAQRLGRMLVSGYKVNSWQQPDGDRLRGYRAEDLIPVLRRLGIDPGSLQVTVRTVPTAQTVHPPHGPTGSNGSHGASGTPDPTLCRTCRGPLLLRLPGRDQCEGCRLEQESL